MGLDGSIRVTMCNALDHARVTFFLRELIQLNILHGELTRISNS
jgi:hypothetical protein